MNEAVWEGDSPYFLVIELDEKPDTGHLGIDLDGPWLTTYAEHLRSPGTWWLVSKETTRPLVGLVVLPGDRPYFARHHVGNVMRPGKEVVAIGLGKECADGSAVRNWILPNGIVCGGDDVDIIAARMLGQP